MLLNEFLKEHRKVQELKRLSPTSRRVSPDKKSKSKRWHRVFTK